MQIHIALFKWKQGTAAEDIDRAMREVEELEDKIPGIVEISCGRNASKYSEGFSHVVLVRGVDQASIDAYRAHPDHVAVAEKIDRMEDKGIGVDFATLRGN
jgi:hypothetical protein